MDLRHTPRLYLAAPLEASATLTIGDNQAHYLLHVLRVKLEDDLRLFNGKDGEWHAIITTIGKRSLDVRLEKQTRAQKAEPEITLCCAPIKKAHFDYMLEKATELGVSHIQPILTSRTQVRDVNIERCTSMAIEAAEQSDRLTIPSIQKPVTLLELVTKWQPDCAMIVCAEWGDAIPIKEAFASQKLLSASKIAIVVGPEGGFSADELIKFKEIPHSLFTRLGPRILRADTAAIAALTCWQAMCGDWVAQ
ncbi:MAG: 16S rRNA (uracil(1498)-N(3))-methyltransferase [Alphaproteobacteria bacterium]